MNTNEVTTIQYQGYEIAYWYYEDDHGWKSIVKKNGIPFCQVFWGREKEDAIEVAKFYIRTGGSVVGAKNPVSNWLRFR